MIAIVKTRKVQPRNVVNHCATCGAEVMAHHLYPVIYCPEHRHAARIEGQQRKYRRKLAKLAKAAEEPPAMGTIFEAIKAVGHDEDFQPAEPEPFAPTNFPPGSVGKMRVLIRRVATGQPLWHPNDETCAGPKEVSGLRSHVSEEDFLTPNTCHLTPGFSEKEFATC